MDDKRSMTIALAHESYKILQSGCSNGSSRAVQLPHSNLSVFYIKIEAISLNNADLPRPERITYSNCGFRSFEKALNHLIKPLPFSCLHIYVNQPFMFFGLPRQ